MPSLVAPADRNPSNTNFVQPWGSNEEEQEQQQLQRRPSSSSSSHHHKVGGDEESAAEAQRRRRRSRSGSHSVVGDADVSHLIENFIQPTVDDQHRGPNVLSRGSSRSSPRCIDVSQEKIQTASFPSTASRRNVPPAVVEEREQRRKDKEWHDRNSPPPGRRETQPLRSTEFQDWPLEIQEREQEWHGMQHSAENRKQKKKLQEKKFVQRWSGILKNHLELSYGVDFACSLKLKEEGYVPMHGPLAGDHVYAPYVTEGSELGVEEHDDCQDPLHLICKFQPVL